ncbi:MAG: RES family NAD+ phosphorylase [Candidatus Tectomicrobia bacterium]|nr:RES family NAD+ phosphorylase [Candidatus Tectomicrobia bacterium]
MQFDIYDFRFCGRSDENRWNVAGEPTLYLAKDKDVTLAEYARHFSVDRTQRLAAQTHRRKVYRFQIELEATLNLCHPRVWSDLSLTHAPECFSDKSVARAAAHFIRNTTSTQAIFVPSMAFLDNLTQWCLVLFLENLSPEPYTFLPTIAEDGFFHVS